MQKYTVLRQHLGDRDYLPGDTREANPTDVAHLIGTTLEPVENKAVTPPENKARKSK